jgi:hypothetical protein
MPEKLTPNLSILGFSSKAYPLKRRALSKGVAITIQERSSPRKHSLEPHLPLMMSEVMTERTSKG